jgi:hypothetical protein
MKWSREARVGMRFGAAVGVIGIVLALPTLSPSYRVLTAVHEAAWPNIITNLVPLLLMLMVGSLARRRGLHPAWTAGVAGSFYGFFQGLALYLIAALNPNKRALAHALWQAYVAAGYGLNPAARALVVAPALHPNPAAYILGLTAQMLLVGLLFGWLGGRFTRPAAYARQPSADSSGLGEQLPHD